MGEKNTKLIAKHKRNLFDYDISEKIECGIMLKGCEIKSIREGNVSLKDGYARIENEELWLVGGYIAPYKQGGQFQDISPTRDRKLLVHKQELKRLIGKVQGKGFTLVPLSMYFKGNHVKVKIGLGKSRKSHDKRQVIKDREQKREADRALKNRY